MNQKEIRRREGIKLKFGEHIASLRKKRGWTSKELSDRADMEHSIIRRIEIGGTNPTLFVITKLADAFEMTVSELMKGFNHTEK